MQGPFNPGKISRCSSTSNRLTTARASPGLCPALLLGRGKPEKTLVALNSWQQPPVCPLASIQQGGGLACCGGNRRRWPPNSYISIHISQKEKRKCSRSHECQTLQRHNAIFHTHTHHPPNLLSHPALAVC